MIKGTHRHMVVLKNTESPLFEEAYFILRDQMEAVSDNNDMVAEANRIIASNTTPFVKPSKREGLWRSLCFLGGLLLGSGGAMLLLLLR